MTTTSSVSSTLLPEILGFHPQLLLDDIINAANEPIYQCTEAVSELMLTWAAERRQNAKSGEHDDHEEILKEINQGLVAFQTLLESHVDLAFDYFEVWTLRNIFTIPPDLPIVVPHQEGLDLHQDQAREVELLNEIEELRKKLQNRRRLNYMLKSALPSSRLQLARARRRLESISCLPSEPLVQGIPRALSALFEALPDPIPPDPATLLPSSSQFPDTSKRPWEQNKISYGHWAVGQLVERTKSDYPVEKDPLVVDAQKEVFGNASEIWSLHGAAEAEKATRPRELDSMQPLDEQELERRKKRRVE